MTNATLMLLLVAYITVAHVHFVRNVMITSRSAGKVKGCQHHFHEPMHRKRTDIITICMLLPLASTCR